MTDDQSHGGGMDNLLAWWMKAATGFWGRAAASTTMAEPAGESEASQKETGFMGGFQDYWNGVAGGYQALTAFMANPENLKTMMSGMNASPEAGLKLADVLWKGYFAFVRQTLDKTAGLASKVEAYSFQDLDHEMFKVWNELYEKEVRGYLMMPSLGLTRFYQERAAGVMDRFNYFQAALSEFLHMIQAPLEKSYRVVRQELETYSREGEQTPDFKYLYQKWVKILEGHFMVLFQTAEYTECLARTVDAMDEFYSARQAWLEDALKGLPVPTQSEMDDVYKELYLLKKEVKSLRKTLKEFQAGEGGDDHARK